MSDNNTNNAVTHKPTIQAFLRSGEVQNRIDAALKDRAQQFTTSMMSAVNQNVMLQDCEPWSVLTAGITAASMDLPVEPGLGYAYIIPYWDNKNRIQKAQFQLGAKGFMQLALRTGAYKTVNVTDVRETEYKGLDRLTGEIKFKWFKSEEARLKRPIIGYVAYIELTSGFKKSLYMTVDDLKAHAKKYSKQYQKGSGQWADLTGGGFDYMSRKTVLKLLISKHGITTTQLQKALLADQAAIDEDGYDYLDNKKDGQYGDADQTNKKADADIDQTPATDDDNNSNENR